MAVDMADVKDQIRVQRAQREAMKPPRKRVMELAGMQCMVLERDRLQYEEYGYRDVGPYVEGKAPGAPAGPARRGKKAEEAGEQQPAA